MVGEPEALETWSMSDKVAVSVKNHLDVDGLQSTYPLKTSI